MRTWRTYSIRVLPTAPCTDCNTPTVYVCMECSKPICPSCEFSMAAMCKPCRAAYVGPVHALGSRADVYIRAQLDRLFE